MTVINEEAISIEKSYTVFFLHDPQVDRRKAPILYVFYFALN
jgi:hypothetical protein